MIEITGDTTISANRIECKGLVVTRDHGAPVIQRTARPARADRLRGRSGCCGNHRIQRTADEL